MKLSKPSKLQTAFGSLNFYLMNSGVIVNFRTRFLSRCQYPIISANLGTSPDCLRNAGLIRAGNFAIPRSIKVVATDTIAR